MLKILTVPNQILRIPTKPVLIVDKRINKLCREMAQTLMSLKDPPGVGLAAPQVGENLSFFVFKDKNRITTCINPRLLEHADKEVLDIRKKHTMLEGCLSIPYYYGALKRFLWVKISYWDENGVFHMEKFSLPESVIIQHEMDHLQGKLFVDRLLPQKGKLYKLNKKKGEMEEVEI